MLARNFLSAVALNITDEQHDALVKTLVFFETGQVPDGRFHMDTWRAPHPCGTIMCLGGWAEFLVQKTLFYSVARPVGLHRLFYPKKYSAFSVKDPAVGARALRNYLTTGNARWSEVLANA